MKTPVTRPQADLGLIRKICANSTSYGMFFELTPQKQFNPVKVKVFSGEHSHEQSVTTIEKQGEWYFSPIAALINGGSTSASSHARTVHHRQRWSLFVLRHGQHVHRGFQTWRLAKLPRWATHKGAFAGGCKTDHAAFRIA